MGWIIFLKNFWITRLIALGLPISVSKSTYPDNIGNSLDTKMFQSYVKEKLAKREQRILQKQHMTMDVDSDFAKSFKSSQMVSGTSSSL